MEHFDVIVIGAGISGIGFAKCYLDIHPDCKLVLLEKDVDLGGVWSKSRGYDSFWTQWTVGMAEFSDRPMPVPPEEDTYFNFFKAKHTTKYLENYVDESSHNDVTLRARIRFQTEVWHASRKEDGWQLLVKDQHRNAQYECTTSKMIVATGQETIPVMPSLPGQSNFAGPMIHQKTFGSSGVLSDPAIQNVVVLGGGKSSADMVYSAVKAGKHVSWVLRKTQTRGPGFFVSPEGKGPYANAFEIAMTRFASAFTPSILNADGWLMRLLHSSSLGVKVISSFWGAIDNDARKAADYEKRECLVGFEHLAPHSPIFWQNCTGGLLNQQDFFNTVAGNVHVYCDDIDKLDSHQIHLRDGGRIDADAILCGTGWRPGIDFFSEDDRAILGLPHTLGSQEKADTDENELSWRSLEDAADKEVIARFPQLTNPPEHYSPPNNEAPYRLYRHMVPIQHPDEPRSLVMIGSVIVGSYFPTIECQALWATAYLDRKLDLPSVPAQRQSVATFIAWCRRRYLSRGEDGANMTFELLGYVDQLLDDLGLKSHRRGWFKDQFSPTTAKTLGGLRHEYIAKYEKC